MKAMLYQLANWRIEPQRHRIVAGDREIRVKPKSMDVLVRLIEADGEVVTRRQLFDDVWQSSEVSDDVLTQCILELRRAFGDNARQPTVIETVPRKGFRLIPRPRRVSAPAKRSMLTWPQRRLRAAAPSVGVATVAALLMAVVLNLTPHTADPMTSTSRLAVMPFDDLSEGGNRRRFADGLAEELIHHLSRLEGLQVTARAASFVLRSTQDPRELGEQLDVDHVVHGSIRVSGNAMRITMELVNTQNGAQVWSQSFDRELADVFQVQQEIAEAVASTLSIELQVGELGREAGGTQSVAAYEALVRGLAAYDALDVASIYEAMAHLEEATRLDPDYGRAWEYLADVYRNAWLVLGRDHAEEWRERADRALREAARLSPDSDYIASSQAFLLIDRHEWIEAQRILTEFSRERLDYDIGGALVDLRIKTGHAGDAIAAKELAIAIDPLHSDFSIYLAHAYATRGQLDDAFAELERGYSMKKAQPQASIEGLIVALSTRDEDLIRRWLRRAVEHRLPGSRGLNMALEPLLNQRQAALEVLKKAYAESSTTDYFVAAWALYFDAPELAYKALERSPDAWLLWAPILKDRRNDEAFKTIVKSIDMDDYWRAYDWPDFCKPIGASDFHCE